MPSLAIPVLSPLRPALRYVGDRRDGEASSKAGIHPSRAWSPRHKRPRLRGVSHLIMALVSIPALLHLIAAAKPGAPTLAAAIYAVTVVMLFGFSAAYHTPSWTPHTYRLLQRIDHGNIFLMIAGSYTPIAISCAAPTKTVVLAIVWACCLVGTLEAWIWTAMRREARAAVYIILGGSLALTSGAVLDAGGAWVLTRFLGGGALYIAGAVIYAIRRPDPWPTVFGHHEVFHMMVVIASIIHYTAVWDLVT